MRPFSLEPTWQELLSEEFQKPYFAHLLSFLEKEWQQEVPIYPPKELLFQALTLTPFPKTRVVLLGQDPYHGKGQAHGLAFSVPEGIRPPPSLQNIFKELASDQGLNKPKHGSLSSWAQQGVLLLNTTLTVRQALPTSHQNKGWETFTEAILKALLQRKDPLVFLLWGNHAKEKCQLALNNVPRGTKKTAEETHLFLSAPHPSPFSAHRGFLGCKHFSQTNAFLEQAGKPPIDWSLS